MAKKVDFKLDDFSIDPNLSLGDFDFELPEAKNQGRTPFTKVVKGAKKGFKSTVMSDAFIQKAVKDTLPKGFGAVYDVGMDSYTAFNNLYNTAAQDVAPYLKDIKKTARRFVPDVEKVSKKWADRLKKATEEERGFDFRTMSASEYREQNNQRELNELFAMSQEAQAARDEEAAVREQIRDGMDQRRHRDSIEQFNSMRIGIQQMVSYQNKVTFNYQRKNLELQFRILGVQTDMLQASTEFYKESIRRMDAIVTNTGLPDYTKLNNSERLGDAMRTNLFSSFAEGMVGDRSRFVQQLGSRLSKKLRNTVSNAGMALSSGLMNANMRLDDRDLDRDLGIDTGGAYGGAGRMIGGAIPGMLSASIGRRVRSRLNKTRGIGRVSNEAQFMAENFMQMLTEWARSDRGESGRITDPLVRGIKNSVLEGRARRDVQIDSISGLQRPMPFSRAANKAIVEIIPGLLSSIHQEIRIMRTGDASTPKMVYDYSKNKFADEKTARSNMMNRIIDKRDRESVRRDIDTVIDRIDPNKTLSQDARVQLGRQLLKDNLENRLASPEALQQSRRYTGGARQYAGEYTKLFGEYFKGDKNSERKLEFAQAYGGLGRYIQTGRSTVQDMVNLGLGDMLDQSGVLPSDSRGQIDMDKMYQYYYGDPDDSSSSGQAQANQAGARFNRVSSGNIGGSEAIVSAIHETSLASTQAIVEAIQSLHGQMIQGVRTVEVPTSDPGESSGGPSTASSYGPGFGQSGSASSFKMPSFSMPGMPSMSMPNFSVPNMGGFAAGVSGATSRASSMFSKVRGKKGGLFRGFMKLAKGARNFSNSAVDQGFKNAIRIFKPIAITGASAAGTAGMFGIRNLPRALNMGRNFANGVVNDIQGSLGRLGSMLGSGWKGIDKAMAQDVFSAETGERLISAAALRTGNIISAITKKPVLKPEDIDGPLLGPDGKEVLSQEDLDSGLMDSSGKPIRSAFLRMLGGGIGAAGAAGGLGLKAARFLASGVDDGIGRATSLAKNTVGKLFKFGKQGVGGGSAVEILVQIRDMLDDRLPGGKTAFDFSGDGLRDGSYESIKKARDAAAKQKETGQGVDKQAASGGPIMALLSKIFGKKNAEEGESKEGDNIILGGGGDGSGKKKPGPKKPPPKGFWGKTKHLAGRAIGGLGRMAGGALSMLGVPAALIVGAGSVLTGAGSLIGAVGTGIASVASMIGLPAILGAAAVGAAGYGVYKLFSGRLKMKPLNIMRYAQYGFLPDEEDKIKAIFEMEKMLKDAVNFDSGMPEIRQDKFDIVEALKLFGIDPESEEQVRPWAVWFQRRFKPVYLTSIAVLKRVSGKLDLNDVDDLEDDKKTRYFGGASFPTGPYDFTRSPFPGETLKAGPAEVKKYIDEAKASLKEAKPSKASGDASSTVAAASTVGAAGATIGEQMQKIQQDKTQDSRDKIAAKFTGKDVDPSTAPGANIGGKVSVTGVLPPGVGADSGQISALRAIRYKAYGLKKMEYDKVAVLAALEADVNKECRWDGKSKMVWSGSPVTMANRWASGFGVSIDDVDMMMNWTRWFTSRFLGTLTTYLSYLKKVTDKDMIDMAETMLKPMAAVEAASAIITAKTVLDDDLQPVWLVSDSPWEGYSLNRDSRTTKENVDFLVDKAKATTLEEDKKTDTGSGKASESSKGKDSGDEDSRPWWKFWGDGKSEPKKVLDPNNYQAGDATGFTSNAGGAAFGYGRSSKMQTSPGSATISGGNVAQDLKPGTGGLFTDLPDPKGDGNPDALKDLIHAASAAVGVDPNLMMTMAAKESGFRAAVKASTSSATGLYQFIKDTWATMIKKYGKKYGIPEGTSPTDPKANALMGAEFVRENMEALKPVMKGRAITDTDVYLAHFLGAGGAKKFLSADPNSIAATAMPDAARANKSIFFQGERPRTFAEVYQVLNTSMQKLGKQFGLNSGNGPAMNPKPSTGIPASASMPDGGPPADINGTGSSNSTATDSYQKPTSAAQETGGGGGYESSVRPVEQTAGPVGGGGLAGSGSGPTTTGSSGESKGLPSADVPSAEERASQQSQIASRQRDLSAQQEANGRNMASSMTGLDETARALVKINEEQLSVLIAIRDGILSGQMGGGGVSSAGRGSSAPAGANPSVASNNASAQYPRPADTSPVSMKRRAA